LLKALPLFFFFIHFCKYRIVMALSVIRVDAPTEAERASCASALAELEDLLGGRAAIDAMGAVTDSTFA
jgi:hypothetical protein